MYIDSVMKGKMLNGFLMVLNGCFVWLISGECVGEIDCMQLKGNVFNKELDCAIMDENIVSYEYLGYCCRNCALGFRIYKST